MYTKIILNSLLIIGLSIFYQAFILSLPPVINSLNLVIVILVMLLGLSEFKITLWWAVGLGIMLDLYSFLPFGLSTVGLLCTVIFAQMLITNFFTNRSLYSFIALTFFASLFHEILTRGIVLAVYYFTHRGLKFPFDAHFPVNLAYQLCMNILAVILIFYLSNYVNKNLRPVFLFRLKS